MSEVGTVAREILSFFSGVFPLEQIVAMRKSTELINDVFVQFGELSDGQEGFAKRW